jgi:formiminotetrahydrofolate cyclodeaminase
MKHRNGLNSYTHTCGVRMAETRTLPDFLAALGSSAPAPGGGAASALAGALAMALCEMVAQLTAGRPRFADVDERMRAIIAEAERARADLIELIAADERAFQGVSAAYKLAKGTDEERAHRDDAIQTALVAAMQPPLRVMERVTDALRLVEEVAVFGNPTVASDAGCAALLGEAAVRAATLNVLANVVLLRDVGVAGEARERAASLEARAGGLRERIVATARARMGA